MPAHQVAALTKQPSSIILHHIPLTIPHEAVAALRIIQHSLGITAPTLAIIVRSAALIFNHDDQMKTVRLLCVTVIVETLLLLLLLLLLNFPRNSARN